LFEHITLGTCVLLKRFIVTKTNINEYYIQKNCNHIELEITDQSKVDTTPALNCKIPYVEINSLKISNVMDKSLITIKGTFLM